MQGYLCVGGIHDGLKYPAHADAETIYLSVGVIGREEYIRATLALGGAAIRVYLHKSLTPQQALNKLVERYKAWCVNRPGGRR